MNDWDWGAIKKNGALATIGSIYANINTFSLNY